MGWKMKKNIEIRLAGFGGQGIILAGYIIGKAAAIFDDISIIGAEFPGRKEA